MTKRRVLVSVVTAVVLVTVGVAGFVITSDFLVFQPGVKTVINALPQEERHLPPNVKHLFARLEEKELNLWVARNLLQDCSPRTGMARWNTRFTLWILLVPRFYSREQRESLFAHYLQAESVQGLREVSQESFGKAPELLSPEEVLGLLAVTKAPKRNSPSRHPEKYREEVERLKRRYGAV